jgi:hypothetical protein
LLGRFKDRAPFLCRHVDLPYLIQRGSEFFCADEIASIAPLSYGRFERELGRRLCFRIEGALMTMAVADYFENEL